MKVFSKNKSSIGFSTDYIGRENDVIRRNSCKVALETGLFIGSFHAEQATFYLVRYLEPVLSGTEPILNEWSCPLLTLTNVIRCIASTLVNCAVSVVHQLTAKVSCQNRR
ncbi:hypothetical protein EMCRGX_G009413 [Ephydatia muelleri]